MSTMYIVLPSRVLSRGAIGTSCIGPGHTSRVQDRHFLACQVHPPSGTHVDLPSVVHPAPLLPDRGSTCSRPFLPPTIVHLPVLVSLLGALARSRLLGGRQRSPRPETVCHPPYEPAGERTTAKRQRCLRCATLAVGRPTLIMRVKLATEASATALRVSVRAPLIPVQTPAQACALG